MLRKSRIDVPGTLHHIIVRGIKQKETFKDDPDRNNFLDPIAFALDFQNDYDIIEHQIPAMGFLADQIAVMHYDMNLLSSVE